MTLIRSVAGLGALGVGDLPSHESLFVLVAALAPELAIAVGEGNARLGLSDSMLLPFIGHPKRCLLPY